MVKQYTAIIDVDTLIIHAALAGQKSSVIARHKKTGWERLFNNQTEFFGHYLKREGGWLSELNAKREDDKKVSPDDFELISVIEKVEDVIHPNGQIITPEMIVKGRFKAKIEAITNQPWCKDFKICFATGKSFRYGIAQTQPYKNNRPAKPILYEVVRDYMLYKYKDYILTAVDVESDEIVTSELWKAWIKAERDHSKLDVVGVHIDKDLLQFPQLHYNFDNPELGLVEISPLQAIKNLAYQHLCGDTIDSVRGLPELNPELYKKYSIRKAGKPGLGAKTAQALIDPCETPKEVFERVVEAYKAYYTEPKEFTTFRGDVLNWDWMDHLNEQFRLLRMRTDVNKDVGHVSEFLDKLGVKYD